MKLVHGVLLVALGSFTGIGAATASIYLGFQWPVALVLGASTLGGMAMYSEWEKRELCSLVARRIYKSLTDQGFFVDGDGKIWNRDKTESETRTVNVAGV
jgi:hypothetical protein